MYVADPSIVSDPAAVTVMLLVFACPEASFIMYILPAETALARGSVIFLAMDVSTIRYTNVDAAEIIKSEDTFCGSNSCADPGEDTIAPPEVICTATPEALV